MSAPEHAYPIGSEDTPKWKVECPCGWKGVIGEVLGVDDDDNDTLWCPQCRTAGWAYK